MTVKQPRLIREEKTVAAMVDLYCKDHHRIKKGLCPECQELRQYAMGRLDRCPYQENKPTCLNCPVHCYKPVMKEKIRRVMRYAGPRLLYRHPVLVIYHLLDSQRKKHERDKPI